MSLNRYEHLLFDYWQRNPDELRFWQAKVRALAEGHAPGPALVMTLNSELWRYYEERSQVVEPFLSMAAHEGLRKISMLNLAEHLLRIWLPPRPVRKKTAPEAG